MIFRKHLNCSDWILLCGSALSVQISHAKRNSVMTTACYLISSETQEHIWLLNITNIKTLYIYVYMGDGEWPKVTSSMTIRNSVYGASGCLKPHDKDKATTSPRPKKYKLVYIWLKFEIGLEEKRQKIPTMLGNTNRSSTI